MTRVGHGCARLPVELGEAMGGYADREQGVAGAYDPLEVHVLALEAEGNRQQQWVLVVIDLVCVNIDCVRAVRRVLREELGVTGTWVSATHTHAGPHSGCQPGGGDTPDDLVARVVDASLAAAREALQSLGPPASIDHVRLMVRGLAGDRTRPDAGTALVPVDVVIVHGKGGLQGALVVTPVHPTVLGADNDRLSSDLSGGVRRAVRRRLAVRAGGPVWVVSATGAAGDISTRFSRRSRTPAEIDRLAELVAEPLSAAVVSLLGAASGVGSDVSEEFSAAAGHVVLDGRRPTEELDGDAVISAALSSMTGGEDEESGRLAHVVRQGLAIASGRRVADLPTSFTVELQAVRIGEVAFVAIPAELFLALGTRITSAAIPPSSTVVLGYTNGYLGYLPTRGAAAGYETLVTPVVPGSGERVARLATDLVRHLQDGRRKGWGGG